MTSVQSSMQFPIPSVDGPQGASSYKEESLLRRDHFEIGSSDPASQRRGTVSGSNQGVLGSMGRSFMQERQQRRHVSVLHFNKPKQETVSATFPRVHRSGAHSSSPSTSGQSGNESTTSSHSTVSALLRSKTTVVPATKKAPPPLLRTWHTPPSTGPPTEPLPSPPSSAPLQPLLLSSTSRTSGLSASSPPRPQKTLPPLPPKDPPAPTESTRSSGSLGEMPPSPARSERATSPSHTQMRQDAVKKVLEDEHASADELREALRTQTAKYSRLMAYLLTLTERHGMEKHEFLRRIEAFEQDARRQERELKGLRWLVANSSQSGGQPQPQGQRREGAPARADSSTLPGSQPRGRQRSCSESVASPQTYLSMGFDSSPETGRSPTPARSAAPDVLDSVRMSIDSPSGSTEEGLYEMQTTISQFIAPNALSPPTNSQEQPQDAAGRAGMSPTARLKRSNTLPDALAHLPPGSSKQKQARRTSSPVIPVSNNGSPAPSVGSGAVVARRGAKAGLGIGIDLSASRPSSPNADRDPHARSDSSTLSSSTLFSLPSLSTLSSALSSIPETPRMDAEFTLPKLSKRSEEDLGRARTFHRRLSGSSLSSSTSSGTGSGTGSGSYTTSSRVSASPSIGQILDRSKQPEMDAILRKLRAYGHGSP